MWVSRLLASGVEEEFLFATDTGVLVAHRSEFGSVQEILGINDYRLLEEALDFSEIQGTELRPARTHNQRIGAFRSRVSRVTVSDRSGQFQLCFRNRDRIVRVHPRAFLQERVSEPNR